AWRGSGSCPPARLVTCRPWPQIIPPGSSAIGSRQVRNKNLSLAVKSWYAESHGKVMTNHGRCHCLDVSRLHLKDTKLAQGYRHLGPSESFRSVDQWITAQVTRRQE